MVVVLLSEFPLYISSMKYLIGELSIGKGSVGFEDRPVKSADSFADRTYELFVSDFSTPFPLFSDEIVAAGIEEEELGFFAAELPRFFITDVLVEQFPDPFTEVVTAGTVVALFARLAFLAMAGAGQQLKQNPKSSKSAFFAQIYCEKQTTLINQSIQFGEKRTKKWQDLESIKGVAIIGGEF